MELAINGRTVPFGAGESLLDAARAAGVYGPALCSHPAARARGEMRPIPGGGCRGTFSKNFIVQTQGLDRQAALGAARNMMARLPAWQERV